MRIIAGSAGSKRLKAPKGWNTRPTGDRVKESIFSILGDIVLDARVLDLFSGTGSLALEALSRGAASAILVDRGVDSIRVIRENVIHTGFVDRVQVVREDAIQAIKRMNRNSEAFDLIFCDPPYNMGWGERILAAVDEFETIRADGLLVFEHAKHEILPEVLKRIARKRIECYGETTVSFYQTREVL